MQTFKHELAAKSERSDMDIYIRAV